MKKQSLTQTGDNKTKKGYNEQNPGQSEGAFRPAAHDQERKDGASKSNAVDKKKKEESQ